MFGVYVCVLFLIASDFIVCLSLFLYFVLFETGFFYVAMAVLEYAI